MKLNHINLTVSDVSGAGAFLEKYFGLRPVGEGHRNFQRLVDVDDFMLTLMGVGRANEVSYPRTFHLGFMQPSEADVDAQHAPAGRRIRGRCSERAAWPLDIQLRGPGWLHDRGVRRHRAWPMTRESAYPD